MMRLGFLVIVLGLVGCAQDSNGNVVSRPVASQPPGSVGQSPAPTQMETSPALAPEVDAALEPAAPAVPDDPAGFGHEAPGLISCGFGDPFLTCDQSTSVCCVGEFDADSVVCVQGFSCGDAGNAAACDGPEDCRDGEKCCVDTVEGTNKCVRDECKTGQLQMCHTAEDCAIGDFCDPAPEFTWWGYCA